MAHAKGKSQVTISMEDKDIEVIDQIAETLSISRSALVRNLVKSALEDVRALKAVGVVDLVGLYRRLAQSPDRTGAARPRARTVPAVD